MSDTCVECGQQKDKFSLDNDYEQCEPCSIIDVNEYFESITCNCECGCTNPLGGGTCVDCSENGDHNGEELTQ